MRKLIAGLKVSLDGKVTGPTGVADSVDAWSEGYSLTSHTDACVLGGACIRDTRRIGAQFRMRRISHCR